MGFRSSLRDQLVTDAAREGQIGDRPMQMPQFPSTVPEFNSTEAVIVRRHTFPAGNGAANRFDRIAGRQHLIVRVSSVNRVGVRVRLHNGPPVLLTIHQL
jgi:hypothetical protein